MKHNVGMSLVKFYLSNNEIRYKTFIGIANQDYKTSFFSGQHIYGKFSCFNGQLLAREFIMLLQNLIFIEDDNKEFFKREDITKIEIADKDYLTEINLIPV